MLSILLAAVVSTSAASCQGEFRSSDAHYANGPVRLAGEWLVPTAAGNHAAVLLLQGSGASDRTNAWARLFAEGLARCGVSVLLTDKRGSGASAGDWRTASMEDLIGDGAAALAWIVAQPSVDTERVGVLGLSQGGRLAPAVALRSSEADFSISAVGSAGSLKDALLFELEAAYERHGLTEAQKAEFRAMVDASFVFIETGGGWERYIDTRSRIASGPLAAGVESWPTSQDDPYWTFWRLNWDHDPKPAWREFMQRPGARGLAIFGERDHNADPAGADVLARYVDEADLRVHVIPGVGHALQDRQDRLHPRVLSAMLATIRGS